MLLFVFLILLTQLTKNNPAVEPSFGNTFNSTSQAFLPMEEEIWKDIAGYEGRYQVSSPGRIKSLPRRVASRGGTKLNPGGIIQTKHKANLYCRVALYDEKAVPTLFAVHRLVAIAFIPNPDNKPCVNHINGIKWDNRAINLEWLTYRENTQHGWDNNLMSSQKNHKAKSKKVGQFVGEEMIHEFPSVEEVERATGFYATLVGACARGYRGMKRAYGYGWKYL